MVVWAPCLVDLSQIQPCFLPHFLLVPGKFSCCSVSVYFGGHHRWLRDQYDPLENEMLYLKGFILLIKYHAEAGITVSSAVASLYLQSYQPFPLTFQCSLHVCPSRSATSSYSHSTDILVWFGPSWFSLQKFLNSSSHVSSWADWHLLLVAFMQTLVGLDGLSCCLFPLNILSVGAPVSQTN